MKGKNISLWFGSFLVVALLSSCTHYNVATADTLANRKGFESHFGFAPNNTVTNVYYYADELGADVRYQLAFQCPKATVDRIIAKLSLKSVPPDQAQSLLDPHDDLPWWKPDSIEYGESLDKGERERILLATLVLGKRWQSLLDLESSL
jgi:hypothetical protein